MCERDTARYPGRVRTSPRKLSLSFGPDRNFYESPEETPEESDEIKERTGIIEEENVTSALYYNDDGRGFSNGMCDYHTNRFDLQDIHGELLEDTEEESEDDSTVEGGEEMEEDNASAQSVRWCYCHDASDMVSDPQQTHTFTNRYSNKERPEKQYKQVLVFNQNCAIMEAYPRRYFVENSMELNNKSLITAAESILDPILYSADLGVAQVTWKLEVVIVKRNEATEYVRSVGLLDYNNRHCRRLLGMAMDMEDEVHDVMVHTGATLYQVVMELLIMARLTVNDDVQERYRVIKDKYRLIYPMDAWKNTKEEYIEPTPTDRTIMLKKIEEDLIEPAMDMLGDVNEELNHAVERVYWWRPVSTRYENLKQKRKKFSNGCMNAAAMLEISAMYLVYMASGRDEATLGSRVNVFGGRNQFLKVIGPSECELCGNEVIPEDNMSL